jgi:predicted nucleic acid-binding protein
MAALVDTSVLIDIDVERGRLSLGDLAARHGKEEVGISAVTAAALLHGVHLVAGAKASRAEAFVEGLLEDPRARSPGRPIPVCTLNWRT